MSEISLKATHPISFRALNLKSDAVFLLEWVTHPHAKYWGMLDATKEDLIAAYTQLLNIPNYKVYVGEINGEATFLMESYDPKTDFIGKKYEVQEGDCGMHVLVKPPNKSIRGFTWHIFSSIMNFLFEDKKCRRIVVEPDIHNSKIHRLNKRAGFVYEKEIALPNKVAFLAFCTLESYQKSQTKLIEI